MMKRYIFGITILEHELGRVVLMILQPIYTSTLGYVHSLRLQMRLPCSYVPQHIPEPNYNLTSLCGYLALSSFLSTIFLFFFVLTCSTHISFVILFVNSLMKRGSQSSEAIPKSLQQRIKALDLQPSVAVGIPSGSKYCCSPRAMETSLIFR